MKSEAYFFHQPTGVFKMVPVEDNPAQADAAVIPSQEPLVVSKIREVK